MTSDTDTPDRVPAEVPEPTSMRMAVEQSLEAATHLRGPMYSAARRVLIELADKIDRAEPTDNVSMPTLIRTLDTFGLTPGSIGKRLTAKPTTTSTTGGTPGGNDDGKPSARSRVTSIRSRRPA